VAETNAGPAATHTITPHIVVRNAAEAAVWYSRVFGAAERGRLQVPDGRLMQVELRFGDSAVMVADEFPETGVLSPLSVGGTATVLHFTTDDAGAVWDRAVAGGAEIRQPLQEAFWGELYGQITDPFGHRWGIRPAPARRTVRRARTRGSAGVRRVAEQQRPQPLGVECAGKRTRRNRWLHLRRTPTFRRLPSTLERRRATSSS
jgi:PhnB protein